MNATALQAQVAALLGDVEKKQLMYSHLLLNETIEKNFTLNPNMKNGMLTPTFEVGVGIRPFTPNVSSADRQVLDAKVTKLFDTKIEEAINPKQYATWYDTLKMKGTFNPNDFPLANYILQRVIDVNKEAIRNNALWSASRNGSGTTANDIMDGFGTIIAAAIGAGTIPTAQVESTIGTITASNVIDAVNETVQLLAVQYRKQPDTQVLVSEDVFLMYKRAYRAAYNGNDPLYKGGDVEQVILDDFPNVVLKPEISMSIANSRRIIATPKANLQVGTNASDFGGYEAKTFDKGWNFDILIYMEIAAGIFEMGKGAIAVNNQA